MSQHDFEIANQGFPSFRSDLNSGLQALASNSAGATEPSATFAYQFWYDETTDLLKLRNSDDDAWITLAAFDQTNDEWEIRSAVIQAVDAAGVVIKDDAGTTVLTVSDGGGVDVNGTLTSDGLTVDGSDTASITSTNGNVLNVTRSGSGSDSVAINLYDGSNDRAQIKSTDGNLSFHTNGTGERVRIDTSGNVGTGDLDNFTGWASPYRMIQVADGAVLAGRNDAQEAELTVNAYYNSGFKRIASGVANRISINSGKFQFRTAGSDAADSAISWATPVEISSSGISFDSGSNHLDDYEEGTWTPAFSSAGGAVTVNYLNQDGQYRKVGNLVTVDFSIAYTSFSGGSGGLRLAGVPFNSANVTSLRNVNILGYNNGFGGTGYSVNIQMEQNKNYLSFLYQPGTTLQKTQAIQVSSEVGGGGTRYFQGSITYFTD